LFKAASPDNLTLTDVQHALDVAISALGENQTVHRKDDDRSSDSQMPMGRGDSPIQQQPPEDALTPSLDVVVADVRCDQKGQQGQQIRLTEENYGDPDSPMAVPIGDIPIPPQRRGDTPTPSASDNAEFHQQADSSDDDDDDAKNAKLDSQMSIQGESPLQLQRPRETSTPSLDGVAADVERHKRDQQFQQMLLSHEQKLDMLVKKKNQKQQLNDRPGPDCSAKQRPALPGAGLALGAVSRAQLKKKKQSKKKKPSIAASRASQKQQLKEPVARHRAARLRASRTTDDVLVVRQLTQRRAYSTSVFCLKDVPSSLVRRIMPTTSIFRLSNLRRLVERSRTNL
jgi:hypothetical protein